MTELIPPNRLKARMDRLRRLQAVITAGVLRQTIGTRLQVLIEQSRDLRSQRLTGYSDTYVKCLVEGSDQLRGHRVDVCVSAAESDHVLAELVGNALAS